MVATAGQCGILAMLVISAEEIKQESKDCENEPVRQGKKEAGRAEPHLPTDQAEQAEVKIKRTNN